MQIEDSMAEPQGKAEGSPASQDIDTFETAGGFKQTIYEYKDAAGKEVFRVLRTDLPDGKKTFHQERWAVGGWAAGLEHTKRVILNLPAVSRSQNKVIWLVEGEKCATRLIGLGLVATTTASGAGRARFDDLELHPLHGKTIYMLPDNDAAGSKYRDTMVQELAGLAEFHVLELPGLAEKEDVADWLDRGNTKDELLRLARTEARRVMPVPEHKPEPVAEDMPDLDMPSDREPLPDDTRLEDVERALH